MPHIPIKVACVRAFNPVGNFLQSAAALVNWWLGLNADNLFGPLQNQRPDVEVRFADSFTKPRYAHGDIFYVNIANLWWLYAGALSSAPGSGDWLGLPHLRAAATFMWK
ncbi:MULTISPECIES: hypothetical protein [unclassified Pseudomonas]|uniref:hypothetical protein n=1 Tax=unclassified Pseudomonas TaxID=196821 RepID=UPI001FFE9580|nr:MULTISPECIES: hypothetical protein [unclassified Pseudomonas]